VRFKDFLVMKIQVVVFVIMPCSDVGHPDYCELESISVILDFREA
jgi:hypothetical protein